MSISAIPGTSGGYGQLQQEDNRSTESNEISLTPLNAVFINCFNNSSTINTDPDNVIEQTRQMWATQKDTAKKRWKKEIFQVLKAPIGVTPLLLLISEYVDDYCHMRFFNTFSFNHIDNDIDGKSILGLFVDDSQNDILKYSYLPLRILNNMGSNGAFTGDILVGDKDKKETPFFNISASQNILPSGGKYCFKKDSTYGIQGDFSSDTKITIWALTKTKTKNKFEKYNLLSTFCWADLTAERAQACERQAKRTAEKAVSSGPVRNKMRELNNFFSTPVKTEATSPSVQSLDAENEGKAVSKKAASEEVPSIMSVRLKLADGISLEILELLSKVPVPASLPNKQGDTVLDRTNLETYFCGIVYSNSMYEKTFADDLPPDLSLQNMRSLMLNDKIPHRIVSGARMILDTRLKMVK